MVIKFLKISQFHIKPLQCFTVYCKDVNEIPPTTSYLIKLYICYWTQEYFYKNFNIINIKILNCGFKHIHIACNIHHKDSHICSVMLLALLCK